MNYFKTFNTISKSKKHLSKVYKFFFFDFTQLKTDLEVRNNIKEA